MGFIKTSFTFMVGAISGVYVSQNYSVPDVKTLLTTGVLKAKEVEDAYRKKSDKKDADLRD